MKKRLTKVINLFGGPGVGKTTIALGLASLLKQNGVLCEYVNEHAKDMIWEDNTWALSCQPLLASEQIAKIHKVDGKVDYIVTDSPITINLLHDGFGVTEHYKKWLVEVFNMFDNINILLTVNRDSREYESEGRTETKERAVEMDKENIDMLNNNEIKFVVFKVHKNTIENIFNYIASAYLHDDKIKGC